MSLTIIGFLVSFVFVLLGLTIVTVGLKYLDTSETRGRINTFILEEHETTLPSGLTDLQNQNFSETLFQRTILSWLNSIISFLGGYTPQQTLQETNRRLLIAGNPFNFRATQYYGFRLLLFIIGVLLTFVVYEVNPSLRNILLSLVLLLFLLLLPGLWLQAMMRRRQEIIRHSLPDSLDMLSVCVAAGLSFDQAMMRVGQTFKTPMGMEFARVVAEIEIGVSRKQALRNLQARVDISEISSFVAVILQSEKMGMSIADVLHSQAEQVRIFRQYRAKEIAQKLPAKMMFPLALFIFPALLAVILGPTLAKFVDILNFSR
jgi:tight adherence protein C